jgi:hypothetical protein
LLGHCVQIGDFQVFPKRVQSHSAAAYRPLWCNVTFLKWGQTRLLEATRSEPEVIL